MRPTSDWKHVRPQLNKFRGLVSHGEAHQVLVDLVQQNRGGNQLLSGVGLCPLMEPT